MLRSLLVVQAIAIVAAAPAFAQERAPVTRDSESARPVDPPRAAELKTEADPQTSEATPGNVKRTTETGAPEPDVEAKRAIWFQGDFGFTREQLGIAPHHLGFDKTGANGEIYGLSGGYRTGALRLGVRWRIQDTTETTMWSVAATAGYAFSLRPIMPVLSAHLGYVFDEKVQPGFFRSSIPDGTVVTPDVNLKGILGGIDVAADYWLSKSVRLGGFLGADAMFLFRPKVDAPHSLFGPTPDYDRMRLYSEAGTTLGLFFNAGIRGEFDIALASPKK